jgi:predicted dehydrogenase
MIPYAIVGTGWISEAFYRAARGTELSLSAVCSRAPERGRAFAARLGLPGLPVYTTPEALAADKTLRAVYVASPNSCHAPQSELFLRAGKHVLCEKPLVLGLEDLRRLRGVANERSRVYMEAIMFLHTPARRAVAEALPRLGDIAAAHFDFSQRSSRCGEMVSDWEAHNVFRPEMGGGAWNDLGVYCLYPALDFFGEPQRVLFQTHPLPTGADGAGAALLEYSGFTATLTFSKTGQSRGVSQIIGTKGSISLRSISQFQGVTFYDQRGAAEELALPLEKHETMRYEARAFCEYIMGRDSAVSYERASSLAELAAKLMETARNHARQKNSCGIL